VRSRFDATFIASSRSSPGYITAVLVRGIVHVRDLPQHGLHVSPGILLFLDHTSCPPRLAGSVDRRARVDCLAPLPWASSRHQSGSLPPFFWTLLILGSWLTIEAPSHLPAFVLALERDLELTAAIVLLLLLSLTLHYQVILSAVQKTDCSRPVPILSGASSERRDFQRMAATLLPVVEHCPPHFLSRSSSPLGDRTHEANRATADARTYGSPAYPRVHAPRHRSDARSIGAREPAQEKTAVMENAIGRCCQTHA